MLCKNNLAIGKITTVQSKISYGLYGNRNGLELVKRGGNNRYCHAIFIDIDDGNVIKGNEKTMRSTC